MDDALGNSGSVFQSRNSEIAGRSRLKMPQEYSGGFTLGPGGTGPLKSRSAPKLWLGHIFSRTLDTLWSIDSQKNY